MTGADPSWQDLNRTMWDRKAPLHLAARIYDVADFIAGDTSLRPHEIADLGDVTGKDLIHLQCHIGLDTLSWARRGARVTGLDFSPASIDIAADLAGKIRAQADFFVSDVYDAPATVAPRRFDIVYTGVGALCWLPDMQRWAAAVHDLLRPGGELYLFEFHPIKWMFDIGATDRLELTDSYFSPPDGYRLAGGVTYADTSVAADATPTVQWNHPLGEVVTALVDAGMKLRSLREMDRDVLCQWSFMQPTLDGMYRMPPDRVSLPLMYVLRAIREK